MTQDDGRGNPRFRQGVVVSDKMDRTVVVEVESRQRHPLYARRIRKTRKFMAHDEDNECRLGDLVVLVQTRPLSKNKRWRVREILRRAE